MEAACSAMLAALPQQRGGRAGATAGQKARENAGLAWVPHGGKLGEDWWITKCKPSWADVRREDLRFDGGLAGRMISAFYTGSCFFGAWACQPPGAGGARPPSLHACVCMCIQNQGISTCIHNPYAAHSELVLQSVLQCPAARAQELTGVHTHKLDL